MPVPQNETAEAQNHQESYPRLHLQGAEVPALNPQPDHRACVEINSALLPPFLFYAFAESSKPNHTQGKAGGMESDITLLG